MLKALFCMRYYINVGFSVYLDNEKKGATIFHRTGARVLFGAP